MDPRSAQPAASAALESEFGPALLRLVTRYFLPVRFPAESEAQLRELNARGFVVHVMRSSAWVNYLYLDWALVVRGLPPIRAVVNLRRFFLKPWRRAAGRGELDVRFAYARRHQGSGLIFLRRPAIGRAHGKELREDPFSALIALARRSDRPVFVVPELFAWKKWSETLRPGLNDYLFGSPEAPGILHTLLAFWRNHRRAQFRVGEPIDLRRLVQENPGLDDQALGAKVRGVVNLKLARETRAVFGPPFKHPDRVIEETLRDRSLRAELKARAQRTKKPIAHFEKGARKHLLAIAARYHPTVVAMVSPVLDWVFERIYDRIEVDEAGLERALAAGRNAPVIFCPTHKSYIDFLVLSWVLWNRGYTLPLVAAGANLSFFPLGPFLRRCGAFFLRRSFKGDPLYTAAFKAYVRKLVREGAHQEFFLEGGRSRTGKLLQAKLGLLTWEVESVLDGASRDLTFIPVSIDYEKLIESKSYSRELAGAEKRPEDVKGLLKMPGVLRSRYGRIYLTFDQPISLRQVMHERGLAARSDQELSEDDDTKRGLIQGLAHRILYGMAKVSTVTPQALLAAALLADWGERPVPARVIAERVGLLRALLHRDGAPFSRLLDNAPSDPTGLGALREAMERFHEDGMVRVEYRDETAFYLPVRPRRLELSFHKNTLINRLAPAAIVASAVLARSPTSARREIQERALFLSRLFKLELVYRAGVSFEQLFSEAVELLEGRGLLLVEEAQLKVAPEAHALPQLQFLAALLVDLLGSYRLAAESQQRAGPSNERTALRLALELGRERLESGALITPESLSRPTLENALRYLKETSSPPAPLAEALAAFLPAIAPERGEW